MSVDGELSLDNVLSLHPIVTFELSDEVHAGSPSNETPNTLGTCLPGILRYEKLMHLM